MQLDMKKEKSFQCHIPSSQFAYLATQRETTLEFYKIYKNEFLLNYHIPRRANNETFN